MKVDQVRDDCLGAFRLQEVYQVVVRRGQELDEDLTDYADTGLLDIQDLDVVKIIDDVAGRAFLNFRRDG